MSGWVNVNIHPCTRQARRHNRALAAHAPVEPRTTRRSGTHIRVHRFTVERVAGQAPQAHSTRSQSWRTVTSAPARVGRPSASSKPATDTSPGTLTSLGEGARADPRPRHSRTSPRRAGHPRRDSVRRRSPSAPPRADRRLALRQAASSIRLAPPATRSRALEPLLRTRHAIGIPVPQRHEVLHELAHLRADPA